MEKTTQEFLSRFGNLLRANHESFETINAELEYLRDKSLFMEMTESQFQDYKSVLKEFYLGKILTDEETSVISSEKEFFLVEGESLADTQKRVLKWLRTEYLLWKDQSCFLSVMHANSIRSLIKYFENIDDLEIEKLSVPTGKPILFEMNGVDFLQKRILSLPNEKEDKMEWIYGSSQNGIKTFENIIGHYSSVSLR